MLFTESEYFDKRVQDFGDATANEMIEFLTGALISNIKLFQNS